MLRWFATLLILVVAFAAAWVRFSPNPPRAWAVDPLVAGRPHQPNGWLIRPEGGDMAAPVYRIPAPELATRLEEVALATPRTRLIAGSAASGQMTFLTRSLIWGFPDFTSVKVLPLGEASTFAAYARARFGRSDFGVNKARLLHWLAELSAP
ncbi:DUF1499 domain-containing protein [Acidimangrovimonas sediminis]|uniref:DUF1499 domain-containing protein n=1 Tax=Acidimangrovimonas sediminis TaxID=2056283 RepID=UPI000C80BC66|nr:DUF1499 domain-containing protein [Acidimangrovimonas sediminis]